MNLFYKICKKLLLKCMIFYVLNSYLFKYDLNLDLDKRKKKRVFFLVNFLFFNLLFCFYKGIFVCVVVEMFMYDL